MNKLLLLAGFLVLATPVLAAEDPAAHVPPPQGKSSSTTTPSPVTHAASSIVISSAWARPVMDESTGAIYLIIVNKGTEADTLLGAQTDIAKQAQIHETVIKDGVARMGKIESITVKPGDDIVFEPGAKHIMLTNLDKPLTAGQHFTLSLSFQHQGIVTTDVVVKTDAASMVDPTADKIKAMEAAKDKAAANGAMKMDSASH